MNPASPTRPSSPVTQVPFYRSYWIFGAIFILLPMIIGLIILLTGNVYRKQKTGGYLPISAKEKTILTIIAVAGQAWLLFGR